MLHYITEIVLPLLFVVFFSLIILKSKYFKSSTISTPLLIAAFLLKCISAIYFGYLFKHQIIKGADTFLYLKNAEIVFSSASYSWWHYIYLVFGINDMAVPPQFISPYVQQMDFWYDQSNYFMVRINALIRLFSFGVYNVHAIVFAFISFVGIFNIYLFFERKVSNIFILKIILFGIPSIVFWTSGVHKEAIVMFALGLILYNYQQFLQNSLSRKRLFLVFCGLVLLGLIRFYVLAFLIPLVLSMFVFRLYKLNSKSFRLYFLASFSVLVSLVLFGILFTEHNILYELSIRRNHFLELQGNTTFPVVKDINHLPDFLALMADAILNPFIRPFPNDSNFILVILASVETYLILFVIIGFLLSIKYKNLISNPYAVFCILFSLSIFFLIGLIVNNSGAIVRYRSVAIPFLLIGLCLALSSRHAEQKKIPTKSES